MKNKSSTVYHPRGDFPKISIKKPHLIKVREQPSL